VVLDTGPLGIATKRRGAPDADTCRSWIERGVRSGTKFVVPAIAYFEVRRELERINNQIGIGRLESFCNAVPDRYVILTDSALRLACTLWASARRHGRPTADPRELDCDVLIAAQALSIGVPESDVIIATSNVGHLAQFVAADTWTNIPL
jgi:hypothetical protein